MHAGEIHGATYAVSGRKQRRRYRILRSGLEGFGPLWHAPAGAELWEHYESRTASRPPRYDLAAVSAYVGEHAQEMTQRLLDVYRMYWLELRSRGEVASYLHTRRERVAWAVQDLRRASRAAMTP